MLTKNNPNNNPNNTVQITDIEYINLQIETKKTNHPYICGVDDNYFSEFQEIKFYIFFFNIFLEMINEIYDKEEYPVEKEQQLNYFCKKVMGAASAATAANKIAKPFIHGYQSVTQSIGKSKFGQSVTNRYNNMFTRTKGGNKRRKYLTRNRKKRRGAGPLNYLQNKVASIGNNLQGTFGLKMSDPRFKDHKTKVHFYLYFKNVSNLYRLNAFSKKELSGFSNESPEMQEIIDKDFQLPEVNRDLKNYQTLYDKTSLNIIRSVNKISHVGTRFWRGDLHLARKMLNGIYISLKFVYDNPVLGPVLLLLCVITNATCFLAPAAGPLSPLLIGISFVTMGLRNTVLILGAPIIVPPSVILTERGQMEEACKGFLMTNWENDDIKGENYVQLIMKSYQNIQKLKEYKLNFQICKKTTDADVNPPQMIIKDINSIENLKNAQNYVDLFKIELNKNTNFMFKDTEQEAEQFDQQPPVENTSQNVINISEEEINERKKKIERHIYYYRAAKITESDFNNYDNTNGVYPKVQAKLNNLKEIIIGIKEKERDRFKEYIHNFVLYYYRKNNKDQSQTEEKAKETIESIITSYIAENAATENTDTDNTEVILFPNVTNEHFINYIKRSIDLNQNVNTETNNPMNTPSNDSNFK